MRTPGLKLEKVKDLFDEQNPEIRKLFAKALNLFVSPGAESKEYSEKKNELRKAVEASFRN